MSDAALGAFGFLVVFALILLNVPIGISMAVVGAAGTFYLAGGDMTSFALGTAPFNSVFPYSLSVLPLFVMMGVIAGYSGLSRNLFVGANAIFGQRPGGLAIATVGACAGFGAICGSSLATAATMSKVAIPEMERYGYDKRLAAGSVAAGGTLGIMIPPSLALALYGLLTQTSIGALYLAAVLPGLLGTALYASTVLFVVWRKPDWGPVPEKKSLRERIHSLFGIWDVALLFTVVLGGLFVGLFSPTEAAAVGVTGAVGISFFRGGLGKDAIRKIISETAETTGQIFLILVGAAIFNFFIDLSGLSYWLIGLVSESGLSFMSVLLIIMLAYLVLGMLLDSISMMMLTIPFVFPLIMSIGLDPIWFGILIVTVIEVGLITPPVGMNLFAVQAASNGRLTFGTVATGAIPFVLSDIIRLTLLIAFPAISLVLLP